MSRACVLDRRNQNIHNSRVAKIIICCPCDTAIVLQR